MRKTERNKRRTQRIQRTRYRIIITWYHKSDKRKGRHGNRRGRIIIVKEDLNPKREQSLFSNFSRVLPNLCGMLSEYQTDIRYFIRNRKRAMHQGDPQEMMRQNINIDVTREYHGNIDSILEMWLLTTTQQPESDIEEIDVSEDENENEGDDNVHSEDEN
jgi:hypothetical protein